MMTPAQALKAARKPDNKGAVEFLYRNHRFSLSRARGKHAHLTMCLLPPDPKRYERSFAPPELLAQEGLETIKWLTNQWIPTVVLTSENRANRLGKVLGLNREIQFGDPVFDDSIYIDTRASAEIVTSMLGVAKVRGAVMALNEMFPTVTLFHKNAVIHCHRAGTLPEEEELRIVGDALDRLLLILGQMPPVKIQTAGHVPMARSSWVATLSFVLMVFFVCAFGVAHEWWPTFEDMHLDRPSVWGLGMWVAWVPVLWLLVRGFSNSLLCWSMSVIFSLVMMPCMAISVGTAVNVVTGSVQETPVVVDLKSIHTSRSSKGGTSTSYLIWRRPVDPNVKKTRFSVSSSEYHFLKRGKEETILTGRGALGWVWVEDFTPKELR